MVHLIMIGIIIVVPLIMCVALFLRPADSTSAWPRVMLPDEVSRALRRQGRQ